jgi:hypothetical protein
MQFKNLFKSCKEAIIGFTQVSISTEEIYVHFSFAIMTFKTFYFQFFFMAFYNFTISKQ